jgi:transcriptional regulator with XRE-family HTH domain
VKVENADMAEATAAVGRRLKALREAAGVRQEDVAVGARACGLNWVRSTVAMLEAGNRRLDWYEFVLLPVVLQVSQVGSFRHVDLLADDDADRVELTPQAHASRAQLAQLLADGPEFLDLKHWDLPSVLSGAQVMEAIVERSRWRRKGFTAEQVEIIRREAAGDAEQVAARKLGVTPQEVAEAARWLWGRSLTAVRDSRAAAAGDELGAESLRAVRGHVTRELVEELRAHLEGAR